MQRAHVSNASIRAHKYLVEVVVASVSQSYTEDCNDVGLIATYPKLGGQSSIKLASSLH